MIDVSFETLRDGLCESQSQICKAIVKVASSDKSIDQCVPMNLAIVVDNSSSMKGARFDAAKKAANRILDQLTDNDAASVVIYNSNVFELGSARGNEKDKIQHLKNKIKKVDAKGSTNLHKGWLEGAASISNCISNKGVRRVLLLSDGMTNGGITDVLTIANHVSVLADRGISTSTVGIGERFNERLLTAMASHGQGNAYYSEETEDLLDGYEEEFMAIKNSSAANITLHVEPMKYVQMEIKNDYLEAGQYQWKLPHLSNGGEIQTLFDFLIEREAIEGKTSLTVAKAFITYQDLQGETHQSETAWLKLNILPIDSYDALSENQKVKRRSQEMEVAILRRSLQSAVYNSDWFLAERLLQQAKLVAAGNEWLSRSLKDLENLMAKKNSAQIGKEAWYMADKLNKRQVARDEDEKYDINKEFSKAAYLRRKTAQGKRFS